MNDHRSSRSHDSTNTVNLVVTAMIMVSFLEASYALRNATRTRENEFLFSNLSQRTQQCHLEPREYQERFDSLNSQSDISQARRNYHEQKQQSDLSCEKMMVSDV